MLHYIQIFYPSRDIFVTNEICAPHPITQLKRHIYPYQRRDGKANMSNGAKKQVHLVLAVCVG